MQTGAWKYRSVTGEYAADQWLFENGKWYRFDKDGNMITGWYQNPVTKGLVLSVGERKYGNRLGSGWWPLVLSECVR